MSKRSVQHASSCESEDERVEEAPRKSLRKSIKTVPFSLCSPSPVRRQSRKRGLSVSTPTPTRVEPSIGTRRSIRLGSTLQSVGALEDPEEVSSSNSSPEKSPLSKRKSINTECSKAGIELLSTPSRSRRLLVETPKRGSINETPKKKEENATSSKIVLSIKKKNSGLVSETKFIPSPSNDTRTRRITRNINLLKTPVQSVKKVKETPETSSTTSSTKLKRPTAQDVRRNRIKALETSEIVAAVDTESSTDEEDETTQDESESEEEEDEDEEESISLKNLIEEETENIQPQKHASRILRNTLSVGSNLVKVTTNNLRTSFEKNVTPRKVTLISPLKSPLKSPRKVGESTSAWRFNALGVPKCPLPCRESQFEDIWTFLNENISVKGSRCMYVSGVPGTGKTVIVDSVVDTLNRYANERKDHLKFDYVYINGLSLGAPDKIWKQFYCELTGQKLKLTSQMALKKINSHFETKGRLPTVLVIDELDQLLDKKQSILYHLFEWSSHASKMFSVIAIFNTMSLPENLVMRNNSRFSLTRCIFPPYTHEQLQTIVKNSLAPCKSEKVKDDAIILLSRKVAALSGDARRALEIAKRAVEIVESGQVSGIKAVDAAFKEIFSSPKIDTIKNCTSLEQMTLQELSKELERTGSEETNLITIYNNILTTAVYNGMTWTTDQFMNGCTRLSMMKLLITENNSSSLHKKVFLNIPVEDLKYALGLTENK